MTLSSCVNTHIYALRRLELITTKSYTLYAEPSPCLSKSLYSTSNSCTILITTYVASDVDYSFQAAHDELERAVNCLTLQCMDVRQLPSLVKSMCH